MPICPSCAGRIACVTVSSRTCCSGVTMTTWKLMKSSGFPLGFGRAGSVGERSASVKLPAAKAKECVAPARRRDMIGRIRVTRIRLHHRAAQRGGLSLGMRRSTAMQIVSAQEKAALEAKREELYKSQIDVQDRIRKAASLGDLSENAEYHFAKEENRSIQL